MPERPQDSNPRQWHAISPQCRPTTAASPTVAQPFRPQCTPGRLPSTCLLRTLLPPPRPRRPTRVAPRRRVVVVVVVVVPHGRLQHDSRDREPVGRGKKNWGHGKSYKSMASWMIYEYDSGLGGGALGSSSLILQCPSARERLIPLVQLWCTYLYLEQYIN